MQTPPDSVRYLLMIFLLSVFSAHAASMSDLAKEKRWEEQIVPSLFIGEAITLEADGVEFLALYTEPATGQAKGAVVLLHGIGVHPARPDVIEPLRMQLPDNGWYTLSLQMPVLGNEAENSDYRPLFAEVPARIQAGVEFLKNKGVHNIVLSGHSMGATMASYYLAIKNDPAVKLFAIVSGGPGIPGDERMDSLANFSKIQDISILDVYGSEDQKYVLDAVNKRKDLAPTIQDGHYQTLEIEGAGHFYRGKEEVLVNEYVDRLDGAMSP